jgi:catechol 2,3-dioxygenase-like lactoylglutathione lyase family enzyme
MSLSKYEVGPVLAVSDMDRAREFYEGKLGLPKGEGDPDTGLSYSCAGGTTLFVYPSPEHAGRSTATLVGWAVDDLESVVDELTSRGVTFEQYDEPLKTDEKGIHAAGGGKVAWFKDPDGNIHALNQ